MSRVGLEYERWVKKAEPSDLFPFAYNLKLIHSIEELKEVLSFNTHIIAFDTETTGLNQEEIFMVGYSFCMDGKNAYYVPVNHYTGGLGDEAIDLIYNKMCHTDVVLMFNMRYDTRVMEYHNYPKLFKEIEESDKSQEDKDKAIKILNDKPFIKYDMTKVNTIDVQVVVYLVDTNIKYPSLKSSEEYYLGWRGASFEQTVTKAKDDRAVTMKKNIKTGLMEIKDMNFHYLTPEEAYEYAAVDALGTYLLFFKLKQYLDEAQYSGKLDYLCLQPLTRFENELTLIDVDRLKSYSDILSNKIKGVQDRCWSTAGREFNLGSSKETNEVLKSLNIHTGVITKNGSMSTSKDSIAQCLTRLPKNDPARQFLEDLTNYGTYTKQKSSYVDNIIEMASTNKYHKNRLRFSYKTCEVPSGRLAAGGDKKNGFFSNLNIQNITKPHVTNHFCLPEDIIKQYYPDVIEAIDKSGSLEEASTDLYYIDKDKINQYCIDNNTSFNIPEGTKRWSYRIFGWVFSEKPWLIPGVEEYTVEGFIQDLNIRSTFLPDPNYYWVSLDFNAEEIRIPALWSKEPAWVDAFKHNKDVHKSTAIAIWGEELYSKDKRKLAKGANFGILYGMTARNFAEKFNMSMQEAQEFVDKFKAGLPVLFRWVAGVEKLAEEKGTISTYFGRPRRVRSWFNTGEWSWVNFAKRTAVNTIVQGTGADILKIVMIRIFNKFYNNPKTGPLTKLIRFKNTIHDEINYQMYKDKEHNGDIFRKLVKQTMECMRVKLPEWEFPMEVGLSIGNRWGQSVDFDFDKTTLEITGPKKDPATDKDICSALGISAKIPEEQDTTNTTPEITQTITWEEEVNND